jgi:hypothetical protein
MRLFSINFTKSHPNHVLISVITRWEKNTYSFHTREKNPFVKFKNSIFI